RRLMTTPAVGPVVALTYRVTVDVPARFRNSPPGREANTPACARDQAGGAMIRSGGLRNHAPPPMATSSVSPCSTRPRASEANSQSSEPVTPPRRRVRPAIPAVRWRLSYAPPRQGTDTRVAQFGRQL